jgi:EAL and modified HD-GYP domain-containing signal transduction protein
LFGLKKLFGADGKPAETQPAAPAPAKTPEAGNASSFLRREIVFDRKNRPTGHLFYLRRGGLSADLPRGSRRALDDVLLTTLAASPEAWNTTTAFIPLSAGSLQNPAVDLLPKAKIVLCLHLDDDTDATALLPRIEELRLAGVQIGFFRQPRHPAFGTLLAQADYGIVDVAACEPGSIRDFSAATRASGERGRKVELLGVNIDTIDEHNLCLQWHFAAFHGPFAAQGKPRAERPGDPHKVLLLNLMRLVQSDADTPEIAEAVKQDPLLAFRILRYLNSPALALTRQVESISQALIILGRQRLTRWLAILLFSVREPELGDWLLVESSLTRGRLMEVLGRELLPDQSPDVLFLTGIFSCLDRLLRRPLAEILADLPLPELIRQTLVERQGPLVPLFDVAEASEAFDSARIETAARDMGISAEKINRALLAATAWASEVTEHWE